MSPKDKWESVGTSLRWLPLIAVWRDKSLVDTYRVALRSLDPTAYKILVDFAWVSERGTPWEAVLDGISEEIKHDMHSKIHGSGELK